jgi:hypothetical protein
MFGFHTNNAPITKLLHSEFWKKVNICAMSMSHVKNVPILCQCRMLFQLISNYRTKHSRGFHDHSQNKHGSIFNLCELHLHVKIFHDQGNKHQTRHSRMNYMAQLTYCL